jgi:hypothetical protein
MVEIIFTIDYEIYGNGVGSLKELVYEPARKIKQVFDQAGAKLVVFVESAELEKIALANSDPNILDVQNQIREFDEQGHEIALHLHPQWINARYHQGKWELDYREYNLCELQPQRIAEIVDGSINYLKDVLKDPNFTPLSFRSGNWLFQPTRDVAQVLAARGVKIDSSVFKGGVQHQLHLDYRLAARNGYFWKFKDNVNIANNQGELLEIPIYTQMVPFWRMATTKRIGLQLKGNSRRPSAWDSFYKIVDRARFRFPLKFDFCRMTLKELTSMIYQCIQEDKAHPASYKPIVAIGHTKDMVDFKTLESFLSYLQGEGISTSTFKEVYYKILTVAK